MVQKSLVSIIILTYNGERTIGATIDSVLEQDYKDIEIIVVDNASTDGTRDIVQAAFRSLAFGHQKAELLDNEKNIGFAGHNAGIDRSRGEFVLCMNQDVILDKSFVSEALEVFKQDGKVGVIQPKMKNRNDRSKIDSTGIVIYKSRRMVDRGQGEEDKGQYEKIEEVFGCNGAGSFFRKKCLEDVKLSIDGGPSSVHYEYYDPNFFLYKEDVDLSWRIRLYGWKIMYCPKAIVYTDRTSKPINEKYGAAQMIKTRREQKQYVRHYSFKNHRLAMIKNELPSLFFRHLPWILPREMGAWLYVLFFEPKTWPAIGQLFRQAPRAWGKRKIIMRKKRVGTKDMGKWFK